MVGDYSFTMRRHARSRLISIAFLGACAASGSLSTQAAVVDLSVSALLNTHTTQIEALTDTTDGLRVDVDILTTDFSDTNTRVGALESEQLQDALRLDTLTQRAGQAEQGLLILDERVTNTQEAIAGIGSDVADIGAVLGAVDARLDRHDEDAVVQDTRLADLEHQAGQTKQRLDTTDSRVTELERQQ